MLNKALLLQLQFLQLPLLSEAEKKKKTGMRLSASIPAYYGKIMSRGELRHLIEGFILSRFLRKKKALGTTYHNYNIMSKAVIGSNPGVKDVSRWHMIITVVLNKTEHV